MVGQLTAGAAGCLAIRHGLGGSTSNFIHSFIRSRLKLASLEIWKPRRLPGSMRPRSSSIVPEQQPDRQQGGRIPEKQGQKAAFFLLSLVFLCVLRVAETGNNDMALFVSLTLGGCTHSLPQTDLWIQDPLFAICDAPGTARAR